MDLRADGAGTAVAEEATPRGDDGRPVRADARRNHDRLVAAAREVFARDGGTASMEAVARQAGVGIGTLYRHFPKRIDLVEAVYRNDIDELARLAERSAAELGPWDALVAWIEGYVRYGQTKRLFLTELREAFEKDPELKLTSRDQILAASAATLERAQSAGVARTDIDGDDLMALVGPMCTNALLSDEQAARLVTMVLDALAKTG